MDKSRKTMLADLFYEDYNDDWIDGVTRELLEYPLSYEKGRGDYFFFVGLAIINKSSIHCRYLIKQELVKRYRPERKLVDEMVHIATLDREILDPGEKIVIFVCEFLIDAKTMDDGGNPENNSSIVSQYDTIHLWYPTRR